MKHPLWVDTFLIFIGDIAMFYGALWLTLLVRYLDIPSVEEYLLHAGPFTYLFAIWVVVFYIASLYEPHMVILKSRLPAMLFNVQAINSIIGVLFFYFIPAFGITPKTILFIDLFLSFILIALWRIFGVQIFGLRRKERAILIGSGEETRQLYQTVNASPIYPMRFITWVDIEDIEGIAFEKEILERVYTEHVSTIVIDLKNEKSTVILPKLYNLIFSHVRFVDQYRIYEDIFDSIPLSLIGYNWFLENVSSRGHFGYDLLKRIMDITLSILMLPVLLLAIPLVSLAILIFDGAPVFFRQERVGKGDHPIRLLKFRTMTTDTDISARTVTRLGAFLRKSRLDELPQIWNVLLGELSFIGPRPEIPELVQHYTQVIPYYNMRHLITPGLSGWAQVHHEKHPHHRADVLETKKKLSYDLYYLKNRSFALDIKIALKTIRTLLSRSGA
jgi:lipopolysaccharide/colanic/teichoic acid biosynthesis glycosyltransferase